MVKLFPAAFLVLLVSSACLAQDAAKQISAATIEIEKQLSTLKLPEDLRRRCTSDIAEVHANLKSGYLHLALYNIRACRIDVNTQTYIAAKTDLPAKGSAAFEQEWRQVGNLIAEKEAILDQPVEKELPALLIAFTQISRSVAKAAYQSSRQLFDTNSSAAIHSLGAAVATIDFSLFCKSLRLPAPKTTLPLRSLGPELTKLEATAMRTNKSANPNALPVEAVSLKSSLQLANDLNSRSMFDGALLEYLEAELDFGLILTAGENEDLEHLLGRADEAAKLFAQVKTDHSIGLLWAQLAEAALKPAAGGQPTKTQIKRAVVVLNNVIPSYEDYLKKKAVP